MTAVAASGKISAKQFGRNQRHQLSRCSALLALRVEDTVASLR
ncbi:hypothetical protein [Stenotrophomonas phage CM2]